MFCFSGRRVKWSNRPPRKEEMNSCPESSQACLGREISELQGSRKGIKTHSREPGCGDKQLGLQRDRNKTA